MAPQTIDWPSIDAAEVFGLDLSQGQVISWPLIEAGTVFPPMVLTESAQAAGLEVLVNGTVVDGTFGRSWEDQLADTGSFSFQMLRADFLAAPVAFDAEVTFRLDGVPLFLGIVKGIDHVSLAQGEAADQVVTITGLGMLADFGCQVVYPSRGVGALPIEDVRSLSWVSADFDPEAAGWGLAKVVNSQQSYAASGAPRPSIFPHIGGSWIWGNVAGVTNLDAPQGINLFRETFLVTGGTRTCEFFYAGDNVVRLWIDGAEIEWFAGSAVGHRSGPIELSAGFHVIAAKVANKVDVFGEDNPAGFILAGYTLTADGILEDLVVSTDANWRVVPYPVRAPGFTDGRAMALLLDESGLPWGRDFTDTRTSNGKVWNYQREIAVNVGRTLLDYQRERMDAYADIACAPGAKVLRMWNRGERGRVRSVTLQQTADPATSDFLSLSHQGKSIRAEKYLVRYADGHSEMSAPVLSEKVVTGYLELGIIESESEAQTIAAALMENRSAASFSTSATIFPRSDATTPYKAFEVGDWITCPNEDDDLELMRVNSIAYTEDDEGVESWAVTLRDQALAVEERHDAWLRRMADGTAVGGARVSSRKDTPRQGPSQINVLKVAEFSYDNKAVTVSASPKRPAEESGNIVQLYGQLTTAGSTDTWVVVNLNGSTFFSTLEFAPGETEASVSIGAYPVRANVDKLQVQITAAGTGAEGLVVQVRAI